MCINERAVYILYIIYMYLVCTHAFNFQLLKNSDSKTLNNLGYKRSFKLVLCIS